MKKLLVLAALLITSSAFADGLDLWIGFTGVQSSGNTRFVNSMIGSNETTGASRMIFTTLTVKAADGSDVCNTSVERQMIVKPAIQPLQFRVTYSSITAPMLRGTRKYMLYTRFIVEGNPAETSVMNNKHQFEFEFPNGGTPSCINLLNLN